MIGLYIIIMLFKQRIQRDVEDEEDEDEKGGMGLRTYVLWLKLTGVCPQEIAWYVREGWGRAVISGLFKY